MATRSQYSQLLILLAATHLILAAIADDGNGRPITLDGCLDKCGNISIPYPFGMTASCSLPGFMVTCDSTTNPPRPLLDTNSIIHYEGERVYADTSGGSLTDADPAHSRSVVPVELMNISAVNSEVWAYRKISSDCVDKANKHLLKLQATNIFATSPFLLSPGRNDLIGVGWNAQPYMLNGASFETSTGYTFSCISYLKFNLEWAENGSCSGRGCCQVPLPSASGTIITSFAIRFQRQVEEHTFFDTVCSYAMLAGRSWYNFSTQDMHGYEDLPKKHPRGVPLILDIGIRTGSCTAGHGEGCSGNSTCQDLPSGKGYSCKCLPNYDGNPYLRDGCQDIDECSRKLDKCPTSSTKCVNKVDGYHCACKALMTRQGDGDDKGPCTDRFPLPAKIIVGIAALVVAMVLMFMVNQILKLKKFYEQNGGPLLKGIKNIRIYTSKELKKITNNYECAIGEGAFGQVYKGTLKDEEKVAIKKSIKIDEDMKKEFTDEVIIQSEMRHKNIVRLLGCCLELDVPMLVYEFVARGSLYDVLFKRKDSVPVHTRLMIAIGSAEGLTYMHSAGESTIRHGDVKSANILLDDKFNPKVSDFGTSSLLARGKDEMTERVIGDMSYIDPIYMQQGIVTQKSDVYSFGIVLIELITRRAATYDKNRSYIANFVEACLQNRAKDFIDNDITSKDDIKLLEMVSAVAVECLKPNPAERLDMKEVEHQLRGIIGQSVLHGHERNYQGGLSPTPDDVALLN